MKSKLYCIFCFAGIFFFLISTVLFAQEPASDELEIVLKENFSDNVNDWFVGGDEDCTVAIENGLLTFHHLREDGSFLIYNISYLDDSQPYTIETKIKHISGVEEYGYGFIWGIQDINNFYSFNLTASGYYRVGRMINDTWEDIIGWTESSHIEKNHESNLLSIKKKGDKVSFYINNNYVNQIDSEKLPGHEVGYIIWRKQTIQVDHLYIYGELDVDLIDEDEMWWWYGW
jgi:hypothetical protein